MAIVAAISKMVTLVATSITMVVASSETKEAVAIATVASVVVVIATIAGIVTTAIVTVGVIVTMVIEVAAISGSGSSGSCIYVEVNSSGKFIYTQFVRKKNETTQTLENLHEKLTEEKNHSLKGERSHLIKEITRSSQQSVTESIL